MNKIKYFKSFILSFIFLITFNPSSANATPFEDFVYDLYDLQPNDFLNKYKDLSYSDLSEYYKHLKELNSNQKIKEISFINERLTLLPQHIGFIKEDCQWCLEDITSPQYNIGYKPSEKPKITPFQNAAEVYLAIRDMMDVNTFSKKVEITPKEIFIRLYKKYSKGGMMAFYVQMKLNIYFIPSFDLTPQNLEDNFTFHNQPSNELKFNNAKPFQNKSEFLMQLNNAKNKADRMIEFKKRFLNTNPAFTEKWILELTQKQRVSTLDLLNKTLNSRKEIGFGVKAHKNTFILESNTDYCKIKYVKPEINESLEIKEANE